MMMELSLPSKLGYEIVARDAVATFARCIGFPKERTEDLKTALTEACINAIEHGNQFDSDLRVHIKCEAVDDSLVVDVCDHGLQGYRPGQKPLSIEEKLAGLGPLRGMGLMMIMELSDKVEYVPDEQGNRFRLTFQNHRPALSSLSTVEM